MWSVASCVSSCCSVDIYRLLLARMTDSCISLQGSGQLYLVIKVCLTFSVPGSCIVNFIQVYSVLSVACYHIALYTKITAYPIRHIVFFSARYCYVLPMFLVAYIFVPPCNVHFIQVYLCDQLHVISFPRFRCFVLKTQLDVVRNNASRVVNVCTRGV